LITFFFPTRSNRMVLISFDLRYSLTYPELARDLDALLITSWYLLPGFNDTFVVKRWYGRFTTPTGTRARSFPRFPPAGSTSFQPRNCGRAPYLTSMWYGTVPLLPLLMLLPPPPELGVSSVFGFVCFLQRYCGGSLDWLQRICLIQAFAPETLEYTPDTTGLAQAGGSGMRVRSARRDDDERFRSGTYDSTVQS
jgi:hypothetical protein